MRRLAAVLLVLATSTATTGVAVGHELDHPVPETAPQGEMSTAFLSGGEGATWQLHTTILTGNPHTDIDFFERGGETYLSAGTLGVGANGGGQTIVQLTKGGAVDPAFVAAHGSAACVSNPSAALGLQHDVEATPKGEVLLSTDWGDLADRRDVQLLLDATDAGGRCHDQGPLGLGNNPRGGLEIIDVTDPTSPVEIGMTSHISEAHTVNVDPRRPHIAYVSGSDRVGVNRDGTRANDTGTSYALDGFEVVDLSSCMNFPPGTSVETKRAQCRPDVYRYRFESGWTRGTYASENQGGCHELEVRPDDLLACAGVDGTVVLDMSRAFDRKGRPKGEPLPCDLRQSASSEPYSTGAMVTDCVVGEAGADLRVPAWSAIGAPALEGVRLRGFVNHGGRELSNNAMSHTPDEDISVSHEAELTHSGRFLLVTDERGGGIVPPDATCPTPLVQPRQGNGGLHAFDMTKLFTEYPAVMGDGGIDEAATAEAARQAYARTPEGAPAIIRATPRVPSESECTSHVFAQVPGQNRIFLGWYAQGTQVLDYVEHPDGTFEWFETAYFVPENANTWVSHIFQVDENDDGTFTYWGAAADFALAGRGRNAIDVYRVTLPAPRQFATDAGDRDGPGRGHGRGHDAARPPKAAHTGDGHDHATAASPAPAAAPATSAGMASTPATRVIDLRGTLARTTTSAAERDSEPSTAALAGVAAVLTAMVAVLVRRPRFGRVSRQP